MPAAGFTVGELIGAGLLAAGGAAALEAGIDWWYAPSTKSNPDPLDSAGGSEHSSGIRPSTKPQHEGGTARKIKDRGGEKGDSQRDWPRRRPKKWKGEWPPKEGLLPPVESPTPSTPEPPASVPPTSPCK